MKRLFLLGLLAATAPAVDVTGTYENIGAVVSTALPSAEGDIPFRGLVGLDFDLPVMRLLHSGTDRFELEQRADGFIARCFEADGTESWNGRWDRGTSYGVDDKQVKLVFRSPRRFSDDGFLFLLSPAGNGALLLVEVYRIKSTSFGPGMKPLGSFVFARLPDARVAAR